MRRSCCAGVARRQPAPTAVCVARRKSKCGTIFASTSSAILRGSPAWIAGSCLIAAITSAETALMSASGASSSAKAGGVISAQSRNGAAIRKLFRNLDMLVSSFGMTASEPQGERDQRATRQQQLHEQIGTEVASTLQDLFHAASFARRSGARVSNQHRRVTGATNYWRIRGYARSHGPLPTCPHTHTD